MDEWKLSVFLAEAVELLERAYNADKGNLSEKIRHFLRQYNEEFKNGSG
jgi:hypothetical protein